jgi:hypothetical protein
MAFGNDLSFAGNIAVFGGMMTWLFLPQVLLRGENATLARNYWWTTPLLAVAAIVFYVVSLRLTTTLFRAKREQLMALMEGKG